MFSNTETTLNIDGIALRQIEEKTDEWLPDVDEHPQFPPYKHQLEMKNLIENKDRFIAINSTITGGGKSDSWFIPTMKNDMTSIVIYPTNALIADQRTGLEEKYNNYFSDKSVLIKELTADSMQKTREKRRKSGRFKNANLNNKQQVKNTLNLANKHKGPSYVLTNPDIFLSILRDEYYGAEVRQEIEAFDIAIIDEFHNARPKGRNSLIVELDTLYHRNSNRCKLKKFVFLSATPEEWLDKHLQNKFGRPEDDFYYRIDSKKDSKPLSEIQNIEEEPYNPVMPHVETQFISGRPFQTKDKLLEQPNFDELCEYVSEKRSIIILDGVAEVNQVQMALRYKLNDDIQVEAVSGLKSENLHEKLKEADVLVANSTVEVGVDIGNVERLVFTGFNSSRFLQRLGRLRAKIGMTEKSAICFTSPDTIISFKTLKEIENPAVERKYIESSVKRNLGTTAEPEMYLAEYTPIEMYRANSMRAKSMSKENREKYRTLSSYIVGKHCYNSTKYKQRDVDIQKMWEKSKSPIGKALQSFRQSSLSALVYDARPDCETVKTYSISSLLRIGNIEFLTQPEFEYRLKQLDNDFSMDMYKSVTPYVQSYAWLHGYCDSDTLRNPHVNPTTEIRNTIAKEPMNRSPMIINDIEFTVADRTDLHGLDLLNQQLSKELRGDDGTNLIGYATEGHPAQIQTVYGLDEFFFTNPIASMNGDYTLALGENALYLYCHVQENISSANFLHNVAQNRQYNLI